MLSEKKKRSDLGLDIFLPKSRCSLKKKKKGLHFNFISDFPLFLPKSRYPPKKKKKKGLHFHFISNFPIFLPKLGCSLNKKKRSSLRIVLYTLNKHLQKIETVTLNTEILKYIDHVKLNYHVKLNLKIKINKKNKIDSK